MMDELFARDSIGRRADNTGKAFRSEQWPCPSEKCKGTRLMVVQVDERGEAVRTPEGAIVATGPRRCPQHGVGAFAPYARIGRFVVDGRAT